jgi:hypothetical protein
MARIDLVTARGVHIILRRFVRCSSCRLVVLVLRGPGSPMGGSVSLPALGRTVHAIDLSGRACGRLAALWAGLVVASGGLALRGPGSGLSLCSLNLRDSDVGVDRLVASGVTDTIESSRYSFRPFDQLANVACAADADQVALLVDSPQRFGHRFDLTLIHHPRPP